MKRLILAVLAVFLTLPLAAETGWTPATESDTIVTRRASRAEGLGILDRWRSSRHDTDEQNELIPRVVTDDRARSSFLIPSAGSLPAGGGTYFRSDITLFNNSENLQLVAVAWLPRGMDNSGVDFAVLQIQPFGIGTIQDFVAEIFETQGLGSLLFIAIDDEGDEDPTARLDAFSRIWTPQPGSNGTVSQQFSAIDPQLLDRKDEAIALGIRHDSEFRANVGVVNLDDVQHAWRIDILAEDGQAMELSAVVPPLSMVHMGVPAAELGNVSVGFVLLNAEPDFEWAAYATSNDNVTGDGWVSSAVPLD